MQVTGQALETFGRKHLRDVAIGTPLAILPAVISRDGEVQHEAQIVPS